MTEPAISRRRSAKISELVTVRIEAVPGRPTMEVVRGADRVTTAFITAIDFEYFADLEKGSWSGRVVRLRGCLVLANGNVSARETRLSPPPEWPEWLRVMLDDLNPGTHVSLLERAVIADPATVVLEPSSDELVTGPAGPATRAAVALMGEVRTGAAL